MRTAPASLLLPPALTPTLTLAPTLEQPSPPWGRPRGAQARAAGPPAVRFRVSRLFSGSYFLWGVGWGCRTLGAVFLLIFPLAWIGDCDCRACAPSDQRGITYLQGFCSGWPCKILGFEQITGQGLTVSCEALRVSSCPFDWDSLGPTTKMTDL